MHQLQMRFDGYVQKEDERRSLQKMLKQELTCHPKYEEVKNSIAEYGQAMKKLKEEVAEGFGKEMETLETLKADIKMERQLLADLTIAKVAKGETCTVDRDGETLSPVFSVRFIRE